MLVKSEIFNMYAEQVAEMYEIKKKDLFKKTKKRMVVDARHLLYYLSKTRPMRLTHIKYEMEKNGYEIAHSSIIHGIKMVEQKIKEDRDYKKVIKSIRAKV